MAYNEKHITAFSSDLEKIRARPSMYIGPVDNDGVFNLVRECADNGLDEAKSGRNSVVDIFVDKAGTSFTVTDEGVGIPVKIHPKAKISTLTHVLTSLQSSGKMTSDAYKNSVGVHGVGIKAVTALSSHLQVYTFRSDSGGWHYTAFEKGKQVAAVKKSVAPAIPTGKPKKGTVVQFTVDPLIFHKSKISLARLETWAEISSFLNPNVRITLHVEGKPPKVFLSKNGVADYMAAKMRSAKTTAKPIIISGPTVDAGIAFTEGLDFDVSFYTNTVHNVDGGFHATTLLKALHQSLKPYMGKNTFTAAALKSGMVGMFNIRLDSPKFASQTKEKLVDDRALAPLYETLLPLFTAEWKKNAAFAKTICRNAADLAKASLDFRKNAKALRALKTTKSKTLLPGKLVSSGKCKPEERELFIVEGDSAGGLAKAARDQRFQEVLCLKGKIVNAQKEAVSKVLGNESVIDLMQAIGYNPTLENPVENLRVGRIIITSDADVDGRHIDALQLTLWNKFLPELFEQGRIFLVKSYEFVARINGKPIFADSLESMRDRNGGKLPKEVTQLKGLGEMSPEDLRTMAFDKSTRKLWRVTPLVGKDKKLFQLIMGESPEYRKKMLGV